ncbi:MAG: hypothetical protein HC915_07750 [Anaerolineae bacterium]|nr:hypothetical protein [Anaerolineae bacterium]
MLSITQIAYGGWQRCTQLSTGALELVVTQEVGPRIIRCALPGEANIFYENPDMLGQTGGDTWRSYGGHRLWHAPESVPRTYYPDNTPVSIAPLENLGVRMTQPTEPTTGIQKEIDLIPHPTEAAAWVAHRLTNRAAWPLELAGWALSVMAPGGVSLLPLPPRGSHPHDLLPSSTLTLWPYTDLSDPRFRLGRHLVRLSQASTAALPQKIGVDGQVGWGAYWQDGLLFLKCYAHVPGGALRRPGLRAGGLHQCADAGTGDARAATRLEPGQSLEHVEYWSLHPGFELPAEDDAALAGLGPLVEAGQAALLQRPTA